MHGMGGGPPAPCTFMKAATRTRWVRGGSGLTVNGSECTEARRSEKDLRPLGRSHFFSL